MQAMTQAASRPESDLAQRVREHLGTEPRELPSTATSFPATEHPNVQLALDDVLADAEVVGYSARHVEMFGVSVNALLGGPNAMVGPIALGPVQYTDVEVGDGRVVQCVSAGLYLGRHRDAPVALVLSRSERPYGSHTIKLEGISPERGAIEALFSALRAAMPERTTILLTGRGLGRIEHALAIARELVPATVVFEDIDLVAAERTMPMAHGGPLFDLLNQMEGLDADADLLFLLTTNRADIV